VKHTQPEPQADASDTDAATGIRGSAIPASGSTVFWAIVILGTVVRMQQFAARGSMWSDEAMLALNIASRSFGELLAPLNHDQYAPVLFLWSERLAVLAGGVSEWTLRAIPLLSGILLIIVVGILTRRLLGSAAAVIAMTITAFCPALIFYSTEAKPYGVDALVSAGLVSLAVRVADQPDSRRALGNLLLAGVLAVWLSSPAVFTLAGIGAGVLLVRPPIRLAKVLALGGCWAVSFVTAYLLFYSRASRSEYITNFWAETYFGLGSLDSVIDSCVLVIATMRGLFLGDSSFAEQITGPYALALLLWLLLLPLGLIGAVYVGRLRGAWAPVLLLGPGLAMALTSLLGMYPVVARFALFAVPIWIVLVAGGVSWIGSMLRPSWRPAGTLALTLWMPLIGAPKDGAWVVRAEQWNDARQVIENLRKANSAHAPIYISALGVPVWLFYTTNWAEPNLTRLSTLVGWTERGGQAFENAPSRGRTIVLGEGSRLVLHRHGTEIVGLPTGMQLRSRTGLARPSPDPGWVQNEIWRLKQVGRSEVWLVFFHSFDSGHLFMTRALDAAGGRMLQRIVGREAYAYLYDLRTVTFR
jgi:hypothetical protein